MIWHSSDKDSVLGFFSVDKEKGLSNELVNSIYESNQNEQKSNLCFHKILLKQFNNYITIFMAVAIALSIAISLMTELNTWLSAIIIFILLVADNAFNAYQEYTSQKTMVDVEKLTEATANVLRDGEISLIPAQNLIPGDIIVLGEGDYIPADCRLIETTALRCDEYSLTGETVFVDKDANYIGEDITEITERRNMIFAGCTVMAGSCKAVVTETNDATEISKHNSLNAHEETQLARCNKSANNAYKISLFLVIGVCILYFIISVMFGVTSYTNQNFAALVSQAFTNSVALAITSIPSVLPAIVTIIIGQGIKRFWGDNVLIRRPSAIESIANVSVICADKTGCLTSDDMSVAKLFDGSQILDIDGELTAQSLMLLKLGMICGNGIDTLDNSSRIIKDTTDEAIALACHKFTAISAEDAVNIYPLLGHVPFDNERKLITTINMINGKPFVISKGAPESLVQKCRGLNATRVGEIVDNMAEDVLRVIAVAYKEIDEVPAIPTADTLENDLVFVGLIGLYDTPGEDVVKTAAVAEKNGIRTVMLTGDNIITAKAVARRIGIFHDGMKAISGEELSKMSDQELEANIISYSVFARISPEDRYRIVRAFQHNNETVAIVGSKIDDAPVLNKADVGISLGDISTDVARRSSDVVVKNASLTALYNIINGSKTIFSNIKKVVHYLLSCNFGEVLVLLFGLLIFANPVLTAVQLLLINLITDALPSFAIGTAEHEAIITKKQPLKTDKLFSGRSLISLAVSAVTLCIITLIAYGIGYTDGGNPAANTAALIVIGLSQIMHALSCYSKKSLFTTKFYKSPRLLISLGASLALLLLVTLTPVGFLFEVTSVSGFVWGRAIILTLIFFAVDELTKLGFYIYDKVKK